MTDVQKADSAARRKAITIVIICAIVGSLLIVVFETYRAQLYEWLLFVSLFIYAIVNKGRKYQKAPNVFFELARD